MKRVEVAEGSVGGDGASDGPGLGAVRKFRRYRPTRLELLLRPPCECSCCRARRAEIEAKQLADRQSAEAWLYEMRRLARNAGLRG